jgi:hypothetical protein
VIGWHPTNEDDEFEEDDNTTNNNKKYLQTSREVANPQYLDILN